MGLRRWGLRTLAKGRRAKRKVEEYQSRRTQLQINKEKKEAERAEKMAKLLEQRAASQRQLASARARLATAKGGKRHKPRKRLSKLRRNPKHSRRSFTNSPRRLG